MEFKLLNVKEYEYYLESFNELFRVAFEREIHPEYLKWRYLRNPTEDLLVAVAIENNQIVANYSASPCNITFNEEIYKTALSMTTMTHPEFNGKGLFTKLAELLYSEMKNRGYSFVWGFPNNNSHGIFTSKLGWEDIYEIPTFRLDLLKVKEFKLDEAYTFEFDNTFDHMINYSVKNKIQLKKNQNFYRWRYTDNPLNKYFNYCLKYKGEYKASIVYKYYENSVDIVEINGESEDLIINLMKKLIHVLQLQNKMYVNCWLNLNSNLRNSFEKIGFYNTFPVTYFGVKMLDNKVEINKYKNWDISMGDSDVY